MTKTSPECRANRSELDIKLNKWWILCAFDREHRTKSALSRCAHCATNNIYFFIRIAVAFKCDWWNEWMKKKIDGEKKSMSFSWESHFYSDCRFVLVGRDVRRLACSKSRIFFRFENLLTDDDHKGNEWQFISVLCFEQESRVETSPNAMNRVFDCLNELNFFSCGF